MRVFEHVHVYPREDYLERILKGAEHFGLPAEYLEQLKSWAQPGKE